MGRRTTEVIDGPHGRAIVLPSGPVRDVFTVQIWRDGCQVDTRGPYTQKRNAVAAARRIVGATAEVS
jgi:hypothetical protein